MKALMLAVLMCVLGGTAQAEIAQIAGTWMLKKYVELGEYSTSPDDIRSYINRRFVITKTGIKFAGDFCKFENQQTLQTDEEARQYFLAEKMDFSQLNFHAPITVIDTKCNFLLLGPNGQLLFDWGGNTYEARRVQAKSHAAINKTPPAQK